MQTIICTLQVSGGIVQDEAELVLWVVHITNVHGGGEFIEDVLIGKVPIV